MVGSIKLIKAKEEFKKYIDNSDYCVRGPINCALFFARGPGGDPLDL